MDYLKPQYMFLAKKDYAKFLVNLALENGSKDDFSIIVLTITENKFDIL